MYVYTLSVVYDMEGEHLMSVHTTLEGARDAGSADHASRVMGGTLRGTLAKRGKSWKKAGATTWQLPIGSNNVLEIERWVMQP